MTCDISLLWNGTEHINSDRRLAGAQLQLLVTTMCSTYQRPWLFQFQGLSWLAISNHKINHNLLTQHLIMCHTTGSDSCAYTIWVMFVSWLFCHQWTSHRYSLSRTTKNKSQINIVLPAIPLGNRFEVPAEYSFFPFFFLDAVVAGGDLTKLSGCKTHRWPQRKVEKSTEKIFSDIVDNTASMRTPEGFNVVTKPQP